MFISRTYSVAKNLSECKQNNYTYIGMPFGKLILNGRKAKNLTQGQLAERVGVSVSYISALERGEAGATGKDRRPSVELVDKLARALQLDKDEARITAGYAPEQPFSRKPPQTLEELLSALNELGVEGPIFHDEQAVRDAPPEVLADILRTVALAVELEIRRQNENFPTGRGDRL